MTSLKDKLVQKGWQEYSKRIIIKLINIIYFSIKWIYRYSGLESIYRKFNPAKDSNTLPTGFIWLIGIYVAIFVLASQRYENRIDIIENRAKSIIAQLAVPSVQKKALSSISRVQQLYCPRKPNILNPFSVFISLFRDSKNKEMIDQLKETIEVWKDSLDSVNLSEAILRAANLREASLQGADLSKADLRAAMLQEADFQNASLRGANLQRADLRRADLRRADLREAIFQEADFQNANLRGANLQRANLRAANLQRASLLGADLQRAFLQEADFQYTNLWGADLWKADLGGSNLRRAGFQNANLREANLQEANLQEAFLQGANLRDADLGGAKGLTVEQLCKASILYEAKLGQELETQIKHECSDLLKEPQTTKENDSGEKK